MSAASSPAPDDEPPSPPRPAASPLPHDVSPRKKPRKQMLSNEVRQCEYAPEEAPASPAPAVNPPPRRSMLGRDWSCGWRATASHFVRPADVRRREPRPRDVVSLANQKHVLTSADGWKVHHLTAQMDDLVELETGVRRQLGDVLRALESTPSKHSPLGTNLNNILELVKGNMQRSRIICEGIQEARTDILRVFTHKDYVGNILTQQANKRCFRKHRSQS